MAKCLLKNRSIPIFHRFTDLEFQLDWIRKYGGIGSIGLNQFHHVGPMLEAGAVGVCIDIAHGHCEAMLALIRGIKKIIQIAK